MARADGRADNSSPRAGDVRAACSLAVGGGSGGGGGDGGGFASASGAEKTREPFLSPNVGGEKGCGGDWVEKKKDIAKFYRLT